jgi:hypothetical protein
MINLMADKVNKLIVEAWRQYESNPEDDTYIKLGIKLSRDTAKNVNHQILAKDSYLLISTMSYFSPIQRKIPDGIVKSIGILAMTNLKPSKVLKGECGAGSEFAIINLSEALAKRGYAVYIFSHINVKDEASYCVGGRNPQYLPINRSQECDLIAPTSAGWVCSLDGLLLKNRYCLDNLIVWRTTGNDKYNFNNYAPKVSYWSHDIASSSLSFKADYIYALSNYHIENLRRVHGNKKYIKGCNGTCVDLSKDIVKRVGKKVFYASNWARGLSSLLDIWPKVIDIVPEAELIVYYGSHTFGLMNKADEHKLEQRVDSLKTSNVKNAGMLPYKDLLMEMEKNSILCYPYNGAGETFSIICAAAQQLGCVTVVTKKDALVETVSNQERDLLSISEILDQLLIYLEMDEEQLYPLRLKCKEATLDYTWDKAAETWDKVLND